MQYDKTEIVYSFIQVTRVYIDCIAMFPESTHLYIAHCCKKE